MSIFDYFKKKKKEEPRRIIDVVPPELDPQFEDGAHDEMAKPDNDNVGYRYPTIELLNDSENDETPHVDMKEQEFNKKRIVEVLKDFGIETRDIKVTIGPTVSLYEISVAPNTQVKIVRYLEEDIQLRLGAMGLRVVIPSNDKESLGMEIPNCEQSRVSIKSLLNSDTFQESKMELPCAIGKTFNNEVVMFDLAKAPNVLISGSGGVGVDMGKKAIMTSLLYKKHPNEMKIVLIDPKRVEFQIYKPLANHFLAKLPDEESELIVTKEISAIRTLKSLSRLSDYRLNLLKEVGVRNIKEYNIKIQNEQPHSGNEGEYMPYIVVVIDEFADLLLTAGKDFELPIAHITQMAKVVGIHMVISTYRLSNRIINTGSINNSFPVRMAYRCISKYDSELTLERKGAEQLTSGCDMLFLNGKNKKPIRLQCAYIEDNEIERVISFIAEQKDSYRPFELPDTDPIE